MKRIISIMLVSVLTAALLCSCSKKDAQPQDSTSQTQKAESAEETKKDKEKEKIKLAYADTLKANEYDYSAGTEYKEMPKYSLYDFDKDDIPELLVWAKREATAAKRIITVYKYNSASGKAESIGTMEDFEGHSVIGEYADGTGVVIAVRDSGSDSIKKYTLKDGKIKSEIVAEKKQYSEEEWNEISDGSRFMGNYEFEYSNEFDLLYSAFGLSAENIS